MCIYLLQASPNRKYQSVHPYFQPFWVFIYDTNATSDPKMTLNTYMYAMYVLLVSVGPKFRSFRSTTNRFRVTGYFDTKRIK